MKGKILNVGLSLFVFCLAFASVGQAQSGFYNTKIFKVVQNNDGEVILQIEPAVGETGFTDLARVRIAPTNPARNQFLAMVYMAVSLGVDVSFFLNSPPTFDPMQNIIKAQLLAP